jgi:hypothetical protein
VQYRTAYRRFWQVFLRGKIMKHLMSAVNCSLVSLVSRFFIALGRGEGDMMLNLIEYAERTAKDFPAKSFDFSYPIPFRDWKDQVQGIVDDYEITTGEETVFDTVAGIKIAMCNILAHGGSERLTEDLCNGLCDLYRFMEVNELFSVYGEEQYSGHILEY